MPREGYQADLEDLRFAVVDLGEDIVTQLDSGLRALEQGNEALAREVIEGDDAINQRYLDLEGDCIDLLALQQPVASDLRFIASTFKILTDLERIGDLSTNFGKYALADPGNLRPEIDIPHIGEQVTDMVRDALKAYAEANVDQCHVVADRDDQVDTLCQHGSDQLVRGLIEREHGPPNSWSAERLMDDVSRVLLTIRDLERVGDHAVNIAARTLYMVDQNAELLY